VWRQDNGTEPEGGMTRERGVDVVFDGEAGEVGDTRVDGVSGYEVNAGRGFLRRKESKGGKLWGWQGTREGKWEKQREGKWEKPKEGKWLRRAKSEPVLALGRHVDETGGVRRAVKRRDSVLG